MSALDYAQPFHMVSIWSRLVRTVQNTHDHFPHLPLPQWWSVVHHKVIYFCWSTQDADTVNQDVLMLKTTSEDKWCTNMWVRRDGCTSCNTKKMSTRNTLTLTRPGQKPSSRSDTNLHNCNNVPNRDTQIYYVFHSQRASNTILLPFLCRLPKQAAEGTAVELSVFWEAMTLRWRHCQYTILSVLLFQ